MHWCSDPASVPFLIFKLNIMDMNVDDFINSIHEHYKLYNDTTLPGEQYPTWLDNQQLEWVKKAFDEVVLGNKLTKQELPMEEIQGYHYPEHITVAQALAMLDNITVDKEGFVSTWKLASVDGGSLYYDLVRDNHVLATVIIPVNNEKLYRLELANIRDIISPDSYMAIIGDNQMRYYIKKDDPLTLQEFLETYGDHYMSFVSIQNNVVTYQSSYHGYIVKAEIGINNEFKEVETANSLYRIADTGYYEFTFE